MIKLTLPDGSIKEVKTGTTSLEIAKSISEGLARKVLAAKINNEVWDLTRPIKEDSSLQLLTFSDNSGNITKSGFNVSYIRRVGWYDFHNY